MVTVLLLGVVSVTALAVFNELNHDARRYGIERRLAEAEMAAVGGLNEVVNDAELLMKIPGDPGQPAELSYQKPEASVFFSGAAHDPKYSARVTLVRTAPVLESSQRRARALLFEVEVRGRASNGEACQLEAMIYRLGTVPEHVLGAETYGR